MDKTKVIKTRKGMTLVELLVAIVILSMGMIGFTLLAARVWKIKGYALEAATETAGASRVLTKITHELRSARQGDDGSYPIKELGPYSLTIYRNDDGDAGGTAERVHYFLDNGMLKKGVTKSSGGTYPEGDQEVTVLLNYVTNEDKNEPLFFYYGNGYPATTSDPLPPAPAPYDVRLVRVHIWVNVRPIVAPENVNLESFAELRNLNEF